MTFPLPRHRAPALPPRFVVMLVVLFAGGTIARGLGYVTADPGRTMALVVEQGLSHARLTPAAWGWTLIATGIAVLAAYGSRIHVAVFLAHGIATVVYLTVTVGLLQAAFDLQTGWAHAAPTLLGMLWHALIARLTGPLPPRTTPPVSEGAPGATGH